MRRVSIVCVVIVVVLATLLPASAPLSVPAQATELGPVTAEQLGDLGGHLPLSFEANRGQTDGQVNFLARGRGYTLFLTPEEAVLSLVPVHSSAAMRSGLSTSGAGEDSNRTGTVLRLQLIDANPEPQVAGLEELPGKVNYLLGNDPSQWRIDIPTYAKVRYSEVYLGVDLVYYGNPQQLEYDFLLAPEADPSSIRLGLRGVDAVAIDQKGTLILSTGEGEVRFQRPTIWQDVDGGRQEVDGGYVLLGPQQVGFSVGSYDPARSLVIDPGLLYSTYLGGGDFDAANGIAVDSAGNAYVTGQTSSTDFPTTSGAFQTTYGGGSDDAFVAKLNPTGTALVYSTYLGGSGDDFGRGIAIDPAGNAYVTGGTDSTNFPTTPGAFQTTLRGIGNAFVTKLNPAGKGLVYSTYLGAGGGGGDAGNAIVVDGAGNAYVTGRTESTDFPTTPGAFQTTFAGGYTAFVTKFNPAGKALVYSTYLGGTNGDEGTGITVDGANNAYISGYTFSIDFPTTPGAFQRTRAGDSDAFVTKLNPAGKALVYSTYLGGSLRELFVQIAIDRGGNAYVTGFTASANFPTTPGSFQTTFPGANTAFVTKFNPAGKALVYSTYLGGTNGGSGSDIAVDSAGNAYITGGTGSTDFPTTPGAFQTVYGGGVSDAFVTKLNPVGNALVYSSYLGGTEGDYGNAIAMDSAGNAYVSGQTSSTDFPITPKAFQTTYGGGNFDAFVAKLDLSVNPHFQPPLGSLVMSGPSTATPGSLITYRVEFTLTANAANVVLKDTFLNSLSLVGSVTCFAGSAPCPHGVIQQLEGKSPDRQTWNFTLGDLPAGTYTLTFTAQVPSKIQPNRAVKNTVDLYASTGWKGKDELSTQVPPR